MWRNPVTAARYHATNHRGDDAYARRVYRNWIRWVTPSLSVVARSLKRGNSLVVDSVTAFPILGPGWAFRHIIYLLVLLRRTGCSSTTDLCNLYTLYEIRIFAKPEKNVVDWAEKGSNMRGAFFLTRIGEQRCEKCKVSKDRRAAPRARPRARRPPVHRSLLPTPPNPYTSQPYYRFVSSLTFAVTVCSFDSHVTPGPSDPHIPSRIKYAPLWFTSIDISLFLISNSIAWHRKDTCFSCLVGTVWNTTWDSESVAGEKCKLCVAREGGGEGVTAWPACHAVPKVYPRAEAPWWRLRSKCYLRDSPAYHSNSLYVLLVYCRPSSVRGDVQRPP